MQKTKQKRQNKNKLNYFFNVHVKENNFDFGYNCSKYGYLQEEIAYQTFDNLLDLEKISKDFEMSLLYIAVYIIKKTVPQNRNYLIKPVFIFKNIEIYGKK